MNHDLKREIAELRKMTVKQLRQRHIELFGEPNNSGHRDYLFRRIAWRLQAQREGGLSERARTRAMTLARDADIRTTPPKAVAEVTPGPEQIIRSGRLPVAPDERLPVPGTRLARTFKGRTYEVTVRSIGFEYEGKLYKSLSAVAKEITGSHWNGYLFFGLTPKQSSTRNKDKKIDEAQR